LYKALKDGGVASSGQIVGIYDDASGRHGFLLSDGSYTTLQAFGYLTQALGINESGQVVGYYDIPRVGARSCIVTAPMPARRRPDRSTRWPLG
jgi:hypothetical protein